MSVTDDAITDGFDSADTDVSELQDSSANEEVVETDESNESQDSEVEETETDSEEQSDAEETETEDQSEETDTEETDEQSEDESEDESEDNQADIARQAYLEREQKRQERESQINKELDQYTQNIPDEDENGDPIPEYQRDLIARSRQQEVELYKQKVSNNLEKLQNNFEKATNSIDTFSEKNLKANPDIADALGDFIDEFQAKHVKLDDYGNPIEVTGDITQFLQRKAELVNRLTKSGAIGEKRASAKTQSNVTPAPLQSQTKEVKKDDIEEGFDSYN